MPGNKLTLSNDFILHSGTLPDTDFHRHGAMILILSAGHEVELELEGTSAFSCRSALIDAGINHRLISRNEAVCALYIEAYHPLASQLRRHYLDHSGAVFNLFSTAQQAYLLNHNDPLAALIQNLSECTSNQNVAVIDKRVQQALVLADQGLNLRQVAQKIHLSESRLSHLVSDQLGVAYKHFKLWRQARHFMHSLPAQSRLTQHALLAGFSDSSHLSNTFRKLIGITPSGIVNNYEEIIRGA